MRKHARKIPARTDPTHNKAQLWISGKLIRARTDVFKPISRVVHTRGELMLRREAVLRTRNTNPQLFGQCACKGDEVLRAANGAAVTVVVDHQRWRDGGMVGCVGQKTRSRRAKPSRVGKVRVSSETPSMGMRSLKRWIMARIWAMAVLGLA